MDKINKKKALKALEKAEREFWKAESNVSALAVFIQPFFDEEIIVCMSTDGVAITTEDGEIGFVRDFLNNI